MAINPLIQASQKNIGLSPAASDLGLGDDLVQQMQDQDEERKKKLLGGGQNPQLGQMGAPQGMSPATLSLLGGQMGTTSGR